MVYTSRRQESSPFPPIDDDHAKEILKELSGGLSTMEGRFCSIQPVQLDMVRHDSSRSKTIEGIGGLIDEEFRMFRHHQTVE